MSDKAWKRAERNVAALLGGRRVPVTGRGRGDQPDIEHERLSLEVKQRKELPAWLLDAMAQAVASQRGEQVPAVVLHQTGRRYGDALVVLRLRDVVVLLEGEGVRR